MGHTPLLTPSFGGGDGGGGGGGISSSGGNTDGPGAAGPAFTRLASDRKMGGGGGEAAVDKAPLSSAAAPAPTPESGDAAAGIPCLWLSRPGVCMCVSPAVGVCVLVCACPYVFVVCYVVIADQNACLVVCLLCCAVVCAGLHLCCFVWSCVRLFRGTARVRVVTRARPPCDWRQLRSRRRWTCAVGSCKRSW